MNPFGPLFEPRPLSRKHDPETSRAAASGATKRAEVDREKLLKAVREHPGSTSAELGVFAGVDRHNAARRLPEMEAVRMVERGTAKVCSETKRAGITWSAVAQQRIGGVA